MTSSKIVKSDIDIFSDDVLQNPNPHYAKLREQSPVVYLEKNNLWALTRYQTIRDALQNHDVYSSQKVAPVSRLICLITVNCEKP
jgi:cytochrome P450